MRENTEARDTENEKHIIKTVHHNSLIEGYGENGALVSWILRQKKKP